MKRLTQKQIAETFAAKSAPMAKTMVLGFNRLSAAIHDLQQAGLDVELDLFGHATEQGFKMKFTPADTRMWQRTGGILRVGNAQCLVAVYTSIARPGENKQNGFWLKVSDLDSRYEHDHATMRHLTYDLINDDNALVSLQEMIIGMAGVQKQIADADKHQAFKRDALPPVRRLLAMPAAAIQKTPPK